VRRGGHAFLCHGRACPGHPDEGRKVVPT
jgi:hypothetical protein